MVTRRKKNKKNPQGKKARPRDLVICKFFNVKTHRPVDWRAHCARDRHRDTRVEADKCGNAEDQRKRKEDYARYWAEKMRFV